LERKSSWNLTRESSGSTSLERGSVENRKPRKTEPAADLTDFMYDMFFGTVSTDKKAYNLTGRDKGYDEEEDFDSGIRSKVAA
jgi:hypothetical protein